MKPSEVKYAFPVSEEHYSDGLTKLELISAMCLQGMFANPNIKIRSAITKFAIDYAKELLKQLEAECGQE